MPLVRSAATAVADEQPDPAESIDRIGLALDLRSGDIAVRRSAVRVAVRLRASDILADALETESDPGLRETIMTSLIRIGGPAAARPLLHLLRSEDVFLRNAALETLQIMGDQILPELETLLVDPDSDVRIFAVNILQSVCSPRVPDIALRVVVSDPHVNVCAAAVDVLADFGRPDMADALRQVAKRFPDHAFLGFAVRAALRQIG